MKQESVVLRCLVTIALLSIVYSKCLAQTDKHDLFQDTINKPNIDMTLLNNYLESEFNVKQYMFEINTPRRSNSIEQLSIDKLRLPKYNQQIIIDQSPLHRGEYDTGGALHQFNRNSVLVGSGSRTNLVGLGEISEASIGYYYQANSRLIVGGYIGASTLRAPHQSANQFEVGSNLSYQITNTLVFHAFGNYTFGRPHPTLGSLYNTGSFGGYFAIDMGKRFGLGLGGQTCYNPLSRNWEAAPIVMPYFKVNEKVAIQLDIGGILQEVIKNAIQNKNGTNIRGNNNGGTIMPPRMDIPIRGR